MVNPYYSFLAQRDETRKKKVEELRVKVMEKLTQGIKQITELYPTIERIVVFGSLVDGGFYEDSDVDIYIWMDYRRRNIMRYVELWRR